MIEGLMKTNMQGRSLRQCGKICREEGRDQDSLMYTWTHSMVKETERN